jgi:hypothetical protein
MEIGLFVYVLYATSILIWSSLQQDWAEMRVISLGLLRRWLLSRSDLIVFELHPEGTSPPAHPGDRFLAVTPSSLTALMDWIPLDSTLVFCNRGVSSRTMQQVQKQLAVRGASRIFWLDETAQGVGARVSSADIVAPRPAP